MTLTEQWTQAAAALSPDWGETRVDLRFAEAADAELAAALLAPLQPLHTPGVGLSVSLSVASASQEALRRGLARLDQRKLQAALTLGPSVAGPSPVASSGPRTLALSWERALATVPADWSAILAEIELFSSDYLDRAAIDLAPINPRRVGPMTTLRFRSAQTAGYGASPGMVRTCLERCDRDGIRGAVHLKRVLCDSQAVGTQGPVWQIDGEMA